MSLPSKLVLMAILAVVSLTESQQNIPSCGQKLVPCFKFINSTAKPDNPCCSSIKDVVEHELSCLCTLYNTPGLLSSYKVNVTDAFRITKDCNVPANLSSCNATAPSPGSAGNHGNEATNRLAWTGITSLLLFWAASVMLYWD